MGFKVHLAFILSALYLVKCSSHIFSKTTLDAAISPYEKHIILHWYFSCLHLTIHVCISTALLSAVKGKWKGKKCKLILCPLIKLIYFWIKRKL